MKRFTSGRLSLAALLLLTGSLAANPVSSDPVSATPDPLNSVKAEVSQTFQSNFKHGHGFDTREKDNNGTNTWAYSLEAIHRIEVGQNWFLKVGLDVRRYDFGDNRSFAPNTLQSYGAVVGLEYKTAQGVGFFIDTRPGLYFSHDLNGDSFDAPTTMAFFYPVVDGKVVLVGGLRASILSSYPVLPLGGLIWHINPAWDLQAVVPRPRLVYKANDRTEIYGGGELVGGSFRVDSSDRPRLNGTTVDYYEVRAGAGVSYQPCTLGTIDFGAGCALIREFDFHRADQTASTQPAPYVQLQFSGKF